ncbi:MAG TPA: PEP-utilizing enzyme, partial [bacterium]|nr:PEP-utilizing enzyme [bacterium]
QLGSYEILSPRKETNAAAELKGLGACPGVVESRAVVLEKPSSSTKLDGEILVTRQTDPGWVVLFPSIRGLIVERGSMLSHSAIVAREMGIPTVVGVVGATTAIRTGDVVRLDGHQGTVEIISAAGE